MHPKKGNIAIIAVVVLALLAGGYYLLSRDGTEEPGSAAGIVEEGSGINDGPAGGEGMMGDGMMNEEHNTVTVTFTADGFVPNAITIKKGDTVTFVNGSSKETWPASAVHPTHSVYPVKTGDDCLGSAFDACRGLKTGESWSFTFTEVGTWRYHDHLNASKFGSIVVEE